MPIVRCRRQKCLIAGRQKRSDLLDVAEAIQWIEGQIAAYAVSQDTHQVTHAPAVVISHPMPARPPLEVNCQELLPAIYNDTPIADAPACQVMTTRRESLLQVEAHPLSTCVRPRPSTAHMSDGLKQRSMSSAVWTALDIPRRDEYLLRKSVVPVIASTRTMKRAKNAGWESYSVSKYSHAVYKESTS